MNVSVLVYGIEPGQWIESDGGGASHALSTESLQIRSDLWFTVLRVQSLSYSKLVPLLYTCPAEFVERLTRYEAHNFVTP